MFSPKALAVSLLLLFMCAIGVPAQHEDYKDVYVINQTPWHVGVAIQDKSWVLEPWRRRTELQEHGHCYECGAHTFLVVQCNEANFRREGLMEDLAYQDQGRWILDVGQMLNNNHDHGGGHSH